MALLPILEAPHPLLSTPARAVATREFGEALARLVSDMAETMFAAPGVGLAAPQVGDSRRILVANLGGDVDAESRDGLLAMVNPVIIERSDKLITWEESCLSVPTYELDMRRNLRIHVQWKDVAGDDQQGWFEEFPAVVIQHEMDHLDGLTLLDHSSRLKRSRYIKRRKKARLEQV